MKKLLYFSTSRLHRLRANLLQTLQMCAAFRAQGVAVELCLPPWEGGALTRDQRLRELGLEDGFPVQWTLNACAGLHSRWRRPWLWPVLARWSIKAHDALYVRSPALSELLGQAAILHHLEIHSLRQMDDNPGRLRRLCQWQAQGRIGWFFPITKAAAEGLVAAGADAERIAVAPSGVALESFAGVPPWRFDHAPPVALYAGTLSASRGSRIFQALADAQVAKVRLVGRVEAGEAPPSGCDMRPPVPFSEVPALYADCDWVLLPYQPELAHADSISPLKLFEAMAAGRLVIASDLPALRELIVHGVNGFLLPPDQPEAWITLLHQLARQPERIQACIEQGRITAAANSWQQRAGRILRHLELLT